MKTLLGSVLFGASLVLAQVGPTSAADMGAKDEPIKIGVDAWIGAQITSKVLGRLFEKQGYKVEYVNVQSQTQYVGLQSGDISVSPEVWALFAPAFIEAEKDGSIIKVGDGGLGAYEGWYYPAFVEDICPSIKSWKTINECANVLSTPDTLPNGRFIDYPADWGVQERNPQRIEVLGLDYVAIPGGSEGATIAEVKRALITKQPVVFMFYEPSWVFREIDLKKAEFRKYEAECDTDPAWGPVKDKLHDCDWMSDYAINKWMWPNFNKKWPAAYELYVNYKLTNEEQNGMAQQIDDEKEPIDEVIDNWLAANESKWSGGSRSERQPWLVNGVDASVYSLRPVQVDWSPSCRNVSIGMKRSRSMSST